MLARMKWKMAAVSLIAVILTLLIPGTVAFYSTVEKTSNVVTSGNLRLLVHETGDGDKPFPENGVSVLPGDKVSKKVWVENDCRHPFYVRVKVTPGVDLQGLSPEECLKLNVDEEHWEFHDGWYYYKDAVAPGQTTPHVFSQVEIVGSKVDNLYIGKTLTLTVNAQAVQSENNPITDGKTYPASGWPVE